MNCFLKSLSLYILMMGVFVGYTAKAFAQALAPTVSKEFVPDFVEDCGCSELVITLTNPNASPTNAVLLEPFEDILPPDLVTVGYAFTSCPGGVVSTTASGVILESATILPLSSCIISVQVESKCDGDFTNIIPAGALITSVGTNTQPAAASVDFRCKK